MKKLSDFIKITCYEDLENPFLFGYDREYYSNYQEFLYENLMKSYDTEGLINSIKNKFGDKIIDYNIIDYAGAIDGSAKLKSFGIQLRNNFSIEQFKTEVQTLLNFYNYKITEYNKKTNIIFFEPNIPNDETDLIYNDFKGIVYHVTKKDKIDDILKKGLRLKSGVKYRKFDERIFFTSGKTSNEIKNNISQIIRNKKYSINDVAIIKIDLNKYSKRIKIFRDTQSKDAEGFYTMEYIPKECLSVTDINEI